MSTVSEIKLKAEARTEFGKGAARRVRRTNRIPAVLYGHGSDPIHVSLPGHDMMMALKHANALFSIDVDGTAHLAIAKEVQRDPVRNVIEHVDLLLVARGEKVGVEVPIIVVGESFPGTIHLVELQTLHVEAEATQLPESIEVSIEGMTAGHQVTAAEIVLPDGVELLEEPDVTVVSITEPQSETPAEGGPETAEV